MVERALRFAAKLQLQSLANAEILECAQVPQVDSRRTNLADAQRECTDVVRRLQTAVGLEAACIEPALELSFICRQ